MDRPSRAIIAETDSIGVKGSGQFSREFGVWFGGEFLNDRKGFENGAFRELFQFLDLFS
jgi:hypothetical protein